MIFLIAKISSKALCKSLQCLSCTVCSARAVNIQKQFKVMSRCTVHVAI